MGNTMSSAISWIWGLGVALSSLFNLMVTWISEFGLCLSGKRDREAAEDQEARMLLTLHELERTMDPLIAAQVYNQKYSPIYRLPEELLLQILNDCSVSDVLALPCLWRVSRRFQLLINETFPGLKPYEIGGKSLSPVLSLPFKLQIEFTRRLQKDGLCDKCKRDRNFSADDIIRRDCCWWDCEFGSWRSKYWLHCDGCDTHHRLAAFSPSDQKSGVKHRRCLGRQGTVQLCDHVHISWDVIEAHITDWQHRAPGDWRACFDDFRVECHDPSHDRRCTDKEVPTWPRARLQKADVRDHMVILHLEWVPHSGFEAFDLTPQDKRASAPALRSLFQQYRQGAGSNFFPSYRSNPLPEMACLDPTTCGCLHYEMDGEAPSTSNPTTNSSAGTEILFRDGGRGYRQYPQCGKFPKHSCQRGWRFGYGRNAAQISMDVHRSMGTGDSACLVTRYQRDIRVCYQTHRGKLNPTHWWFHAMDPATYPRPSEVYSLPECWDKSCMNYRRKPGFSTCSNCDEMHQPCPASEGKVCGARCSPEYFRRGLIDEHPEL